VSEGEGEKFKIKDVTLNWMQRAATPKDKDAQAPLLWPAGRNSLYEEGIVGILTTGVFPHCLK